MSTNKIRVLIAKVGLDGHDVGAKVVARGLADAGMEVIYTGLRQTPQTVVKIAIQEDVNLIGISLLSGAHMVFIPEVLRLLEENHADDIDVFCGGVIPVEDIVELKKAGVREVFVAGSNMADIVECVRNIYEQQRQNHAL